MGEASCLESFFKGLVDPGHLRVILLEAEELASNLVLLRFNFRCTTGLVKEILAAVLYTPKTVVRALAEVILGPEVQARDFILRTYPSLVRMGYGVDLGSEGIRVYSVHRCGSPLSKSFSDVVQEILSAFGESCEVTFEGRYSLETIAPP